MRIWIIAASILLILAVAWLALAFESGTFTADDARYAVKPGEFTPDAWAS